MVFAAHGLYGTACITGLTAQSTVEVGLIEPVSSKMLAVGLASVASDIPPNGIKIGMLTTFSSLDEVVRFLPSQQGVPVVFDPVLRSSSGTDLLDAAGVAGLGRLLPLVSWVTPNWAELSVLTEQPVGGAEQVAEAAAVLQKRYPGLNVVVTGGDLDSADDYLLTAAGEARWFRGEKIVSTSTHGTGCAFSSALLSRLVLGDGPVEAVAAAKAYVAEAIRTAPGLGKGRGPLNHLWPLRQR